MRSARIALPALAAASAVVALTLAEGGRVAARVARSEPLRQGEAVEPGPPIEVVVSADQLEPGGAEDVATACGIEAEAATRWRAVTPRRGPQLRVTGGSATVKAYAARCEDGFVVALANHGDGKATVRLSFAASPGVYTFEKLTLDTRTADTALRFERLQGVRVGADRRSWKLAWLAPHSGDVLRVVNRSAQVERSYRDLRRSISAIASSNARQYRRLMPALRECEGHIAAISAHGADRAELARHAHRALLELALVQAFARNAGSGLAPRGPQTESVASRTETFEAALTELSAAALGLVANVNVEAAPEGTVRQSIEVANNGIAAISVVKVWPSGPAGTSVRAPESKLLGSLPRGATARAAFVVRLPSGASTADLVAHVSYRFAGAPAHLRLQAP